MKKISNVILVLVLTFAFSFALPQEEVEAVGFLAAVPAGITIGAGAYTVGAVALAGLVGIAGYDTYSEEINAHALRAWDNGTQLSKDSMNAMINGAVGLGNSLTSLDGGFNTWMDANIEGIAGYVGELTANELYPNVVYNSSATVFPEGVAFDLTGALKIEYQPGFATNYMLFKVVYGNRMAACDNTNYCQETPIFPTGTSGEDIIKALRSFTSPYQALSLYNTYALATKQMKLYISDADWKTAYNTGVSKTTEAWQDMKDAGLVLPVDSAIPVYQGNAVNYNAQTDVYTGVDGGVLNPADVTWSFPQPRIRTGEELDVTVPPGVYVDNPAGAYNPSLPDTVVVPGISTPVTTGITTGIATPITKTGTGEPLPTGGTTTTPKSGEPLNPFKVKPMPIAALTGLFQLLAALIFYLIRLFTFIATLALIAPTPIDNPYFIWFTTATFQGITPYPLVQNLALFFLGFSVYRSVRRVFG